MYRDSVIESLARQDADIQRSIRGDNPGPIMIPKAVNPNMTAANLLRQQASMTSDPQKKQELLYRAALEEKYAAQAASAQTGVQDAALAPGADIIYSSPQQKMAQMQRREDMQRSAGEYNRDLAQQGGLWNPARSRSSLTGGW